MAQAPQILFRNLRPRAGALSQREKPLAYKDSVVASAVTGCVKSRSSRFERLE